MIADGGFRMGSVKPYMLAVLIVGIGVSASPNSSGQGFVRFKDDKEIAREQSFDTNVRRLCAPGQWSDSSAAFLKKRVAACEIMAEERLAARMAALDTAKLEELIKIPGQYRLKEERASPLIEIDPPLLIEIDPPGDHGSSAVGVVFCHGC